MSRNGRYEQKSKIHGITILLILFLLIIFAGLFFSLFRLSRKTEKEAQSAELATTDHFQTTQQMTAHLETVPVKEQSTGMSANTYQTQSETTFIDETETTVTKPIPEMEPNGKTVSEETVNTYAPILQQYRELIMMDSSEYLTLYGNESELDFALSIDSLRNLAEQGKIDSVISILNRPTLSAGYPYVYGETLYSAKMYGDDDDWDPMVYQYAYYNIDGKRNEELLIGQYNAYRDDYSILAIYTAKYEAPAKLGVKSISDNSRAHLTIYTDGTICCDLSGGAAHHYWTFYTIDGIYTSDLFEEIASFYINYDAPGYEYMVSAVEGYEAMLTPVDEILWQPIIER